MEAVNKIIKRYLRHDKPQTFDELIKYTGLAATDYTEKRPHGSLHGLIPIEAYAYSDKPLDFKAEMAKQKGLRIAENRKVNCMECAQ